MPPYFFVFRMYGIPMKLKTLSAVLLFISAACAQAELVVIVNPSSPLTSISEDDVQQMFLGKKKDLGSGLLLPLDQPEGSDSRNHFYSEIIKKTEIQLKSYWSRLIFTGKGQAPQVIGEDADIINMIATNPNLIGYINAANLTDKVRAVYRHP